MAPPAGPPAVRWLLAATILGSSMAFIDSTAVNTALPVMQLELAATVTQMQWVVEAYMLLLASLILIGGALGDRFGRRRVFELGVAIFAGASLWCGLAPDTTQLIAARAVQGLGGALLVPSSLAVLRASVPAEQRGWAIGVWSGYTALTAALGQVLGGWLADAVTWRAIFWINVPVAVVVLLIARWHVPESRDEAVPAPLDWPGGALQALGLGGLVYGLIESPGLGLFHPAVALALGLGVMALVAFVWREARVAFPMVPLGLFRRPAFAGANLLTLWLYAAVGAAFFFLPFQLIQVRGYSATASGLALLPFVALLFALSGWAGRLGDRVGYRLPLTLGPAVAAMGLALFALPGLGGSYWTTVFPAVVVLGLGMALTVAPLTTAVLNAVDDAQSGLASGINNAVARVAALLAIAVLGLLLVGWFGAGLERRLAPMRLPPAAVAGIDAQRPRLAAMEMPVTLAASQREQVAVAVDEAFLDGFRAVMLACAALALASAGAGWWFFRPGA